MKGLKIYDAISEYAKSRPVRLHMPGHKGKRFLKLKPSLDVTELTRIDNAKVVSLAENDCAEILGAKKVFFLSDGATSGILSVIYATKRDGGKLIINRSAHKSVYNALKICGIEPIIVNGEITADKIKDIFENEKSAYAAFLTYPDYMGNTFDLKAVKKVCEKQGKLLLTDSAHGNHFKFLGLPYAGEIADVSVESLHKTAYSLNQGAIICVNEPSLYDKVSQAVSVFATTSPSYLILASVEYGVKYAASNKKKHLKVAAWVREVKRELQKAGLKISAAADPFKIAVLTGESGYDGNDIEKRLESKKIFSELYSENEILFMVSAATKKSELKKLLKGILSAVKSLEKKDIVKRQVRIPERQMSYLKATSDWEYTNIQDAAGKICAENFGTIPPCEPAFVAGEIIDESVKTLKGETFGVYEGKVKTVRGK